MHDRGQGFGVAQQPRVASCRRLTERSRPVARAEEIARGDDDLAELPAVDPALYLRG